MPWDFPRAGTDEPGEFSAPPPKKPAQRARGENRARGPSEEEPPSALGGPQTNRMHVSVAKLEESSCAAIAGSVSGTSKKIVFL